jgi:uncharacterized protein YecE (DUF72 family)
MAGADGERVQTMTGPATLIGCAGWSLSRETASDFPADGSHLQRYAARFNAVEINSSFYRSHRPATYARWADSVPAAFRFSVKLPRSITHERRLADTVPLIEQFAAEAGELGEKLGCVLVQLPPSLAFEAAPTSEFITDLRRHFSCMLALEARHPSWFAAAADKLLQSNIISRVIADPPAGQPGPHVPTAPAIYRRLHGTPKVYYSSYNQAYIHQLAVDLQQAREAGHPAWCIFDNTAAGYAVPNALSLMAELTYSNL